MHAPLKTPSNGGKNENKEKILEELAKETE